MRRDPWLCNTRALVSLTLRYWRANDVYITYLWRVYYVRNRFQPSPYSQGTEFWKYRIHYVYYEMDESDFVYFSFILHGSYINVTVICSPLLPNLVSTSKTTYSVVCRVLPACIQLMWAQHNKITKTVFANVTKFTHTHMLDRIHAVNPSKDTVEVIHEDKTL